MLQQPIAPDSHTPNPSTLSPMTSPQADSSGDVQVAADRDLLQQDGQTIQVPSSGGATASQQPTRSTTETPIVATQPVFQLMEIIAIFVVLGALLVAIAVYVVKKAKSTHPLKEDQRSDVVVEHAEPETTMASRQNPTKKRSKKQPRRQQTKQSQ